MEADAPDRIASALERIAHNLDTLVAQQRQTRAAKTKRTRPQYRGPALVPVDEVSQKRADAALRRAGLR